MTMMMPAAHTVRFASSASGVLLRNTSNLLKNYFYGAINNMEAFTLNAFIVSSLIQVISRIVVANKTAQQTKHTPEGPYRYMEAVKTTFREAMGWGLSYLVLRFFQRATVDFFRNYLFIRKGVSNAPTVLNGVFRKLLKVPADVHPEKAFQVKPPFPGLWETLKSVGAELGDFFRGKGSLKNFEAINLKRFSSLMSEKVKGIEVVYDGRAKDRVKALMPWIDRVNRLAGNDISAMNVHQKLKTFFQWVPPLVGSIPAMLLSGLALERFSQNYAEPLAQKIAGFLGKHAQPVVRVARRTPFYPTAIDPRMPMPYAGNVPNVRSQGAFSAYGYPGYPRI